MGRKSNTDERREQIVQALSAVMARHGYEKATIQLIAAEAGLAPGLIHYHFRTKQEILVSLVRRITDFVLARLARLTDAAGSASERLGAYLDARLGLGPAASREMVLAWVVIGAEAVRQPEVRKVYREAVARELAGLTEIVTACLIEHGRQTERAPQLAAGLMALMEGAFQLSSAAEGVMPTGYAAQAARRFAQLAIEAESPLKPKAKPLGR